MLWKSGQASVCCVASPRSPDSTIAIHFEGFYQYPLHHPPMPRNLDDLISVTGAVKSNGPETKLDRKSMASIIRWFLSAE